MYLCAVGLFATRVLSAFSDEDIDSRNNSGAGDASSKWEVARLAEFQEGTCQPGTYWAAHIVESSNSSANECRPCLRELFSDDLNAASCRNCSEIDPTTWGNSPLNGSTSCVPLEQVYLSPTNWLFTCDSLLLALCMVAHVALLLFHIIFVQLTFVQVLLLSSVFLYFGLILTHLLPPAMLTCLLRRIGTWLCQSIFFMSMINKRIQFNDYYSSCCPGTLAVRRKCNWDRDIFYLSISSIPVIAMSGLSLLISHPIPGVIQELYYDNSTETAPKLAIWCEEGPFILNLFCALYVLALPLIAVGSFETPFLRKTGHEHRRKSVIAYFILIEMVLSGFAATFKLYLHGRYPAVSDGVAAFLFIVIACTIVGGISVQITLFTYWNWSSSLPHADSLEAVGKSEHFLVDDVSSYWTEYDGEMSLTTVNSARL